MDGAIYLLHLDRKVADHAGHYLGWSRDLDQRLAAHRKGTGARLMEVCAERGINFTLARTWNGDRHLERKLKRRKAAPRLCPICRPPQQGVA